MIKLPEPAAHGIFDSEGFYEAALDKASAERFCAHYNARKNGPLKPFTHQPFHTADQLKQAIRDALEEAAKVADSMAPEFGEKGWAAKERGDLTLSLGMLGVEFQLKECAAAIRKLKEDIQ